MHASVMKWREGRASAIKGMVMPMVKRMGTCRAYGIKGGRGETQQPKRTSSGERWEGDGEGGDIYTVRLQRGYR